jgi:uncharacterized protein
VVSLANSVTRPDRFVPRVMRAAVAALVGLLVAVPAAAQTDVQIPPPRGLVNDFAGVIQPDVARQIEAVAQYVRDRSGGEIAIVTMRDLAGREAADVALRIGREWKVGAKADIGDARRNAGVVVLLVPRETSADGSGQISISVGNGAEGFIPDGVAGAIRREATTRFQLGDYGGGLLIITVRLAERYADQFGFSLDSIAGVPAARRGAPRGIQPGAAVIVFIILVMLLSGGGRGCGCAPLWLGHSLGRSMRRGGWHGHGGFGGGGWSGGGGGFGGFGGGGGFSGGGSSGRF